MNSVNITARLTRDPELVDTRGGTPVCNLRVAIERRGEGAVFTDVKTFGAQATACNAHLSKGELVAVIGRLELDEWEAQGGGKRSRLYVIGERVEFLGRQAGRPPSEAPAAAAAPAPATEEVPASVA
jgi:single-strand DNA-binding protein